MSLLVFLVFLLTCSLEDYGRSVSSGVTFYVGPVGGSGFVFLIILVVVSVLDRCSAVWRFGAGALVVTLMYLYNRYTHWHSCKHSGIPICSQHL